MAKKKPKAAQSNIAVATADWDEALGEDATLKPAQPPEIIPREPIQPQEVYVGSSPNEISEYLKEVIEEELKYPQLSDQQRQIICSGLRRVLNSISPERQDQAAQEEITPLSLTEAQAYGKRKQEYGKFSGKPMSSIPREYLGWLADNKRKEVTEWKSLLRYLKYLDSKQAE